MLLCRDTLLKGPAPWFSRLCNGLAGHYVQRQELRASLSGAESLSPPLRRCCKPLKRSNVAFGIPAEHD